MVQRKETTSATTIAEAVRNILAENSRRLGIINAPFNPYTGEGAVGERQHVHIEDFPIPDQWLPVEMLRVPLVKQVLKAGSICKFITDYLKVEYSDEERLKVIDAFVRVRYKEDFCFWAATNVYIKNKGGGDDVLFVLTRPQRRFVARLEKLRRANKPIRLILLKARQCGGSTTSQHVKGEAADIYVTRPKEMAELFALIYYTLPYDQLIWERGTDEAPAWIHVSYRRGGDMANRYQCLRYDGKKYYPYKPTLR
jgi:hypothetical protein